MVTPAAKGKTTLKLLLIIAMMVQPVLVSYAMADMLGSHHPVSAAVAPAGDTFAFAGDMLSHAQHSDQHQGGIVDNAPVVDDDTSASNDCCDSIHCCPAAVVDIDDSLHQKNPVAPVALRFSWEGVSLSAEFRPPRSLLG